MKKIYLLIALSLVTVMTKAQCFVQVTGTDIQCNGMANGSATATPVGVPNYSYLWQPGGMTTATVSNLGPGTYTVTVIDGTSCMSTGTVTIAEPTPITAVSTQTNVVCYGTCTGQATAFTGGGTGPYTHKWTTNPVQMSATATNLCAGMYNDSITDSKGCKTVMTVTITQPAPFVANVVCSGVSCFGGSNGTATANHTGGTPGFSYSWNTIPAQTTQSISNLSPGTYSCTITDTMGCTAISGCTVNQPSAALSATATSNNAGCSSCCDGSASVAASGGTPGYVYSWSPGGQTTQTVTNLCPGNYTVCVTDANGCPAACNQVSVNFNTGINEYSNYSMNFYPNPTSDNFEIRITPPVTGEVKCVLVDIIGNEILSETMVINAAGNNRLSVRNLSDGVYFLKVRVNDKWITEKLIKYQRRLIKREITGEGFPVIFLIIKK